MSTGQELARAYRRWISKRHRQVLAEAAEEVLDWVREDAAAPDDETMREGGFLALSLPRRYRLRYSRAFAAQFADAVEHTIAAMASEDRVPLSCTAEELAAYLIAVRADEILRQRPGTSQVRDEVFEWVIGDSDVLFLYDDASDGIDEALPAGGVVNLSFAKWFTPFGQEQEEP